MESRSTIDRRKFLKYSGITGAAFILGFSGYKLMGDSEVVNLSEAAEAYDLTPYIIIESSGPITLVNPRPEIGQGTYQSIPALIAEELEVSLDQVKIKPSSGEKAFGFQLVGGSASVKESYLPLRKAGAAAREMLIKAASGKWNVPPGECYASNGQVIHKPSGKKLSYAELAEAASKLEVPREPKLKDPNDFKILGKAAPRPDIPLKVTGKAVFGIDVEVPGMMYASVERSPVFGSKLLSFDDAESRKVAGVSDVVKVRRVVGKNKYEGVAVVASNYWAALKGRKALKVKWDNGKFGGFNSKDYEQSLRDLAKADGVPVKAAGNFDKSFSGAPMKLEALYETPMVSHSPMEPMNCTAHWQEGNKVEVWLSSQGPSLVKGELSKTLGIPEDDIKVNIQFTGGGFGRRLSSDFAAEAAEISKAVGKPVKVIWTREDDTQLGPFRPMTFSAMKGALSADQKVVAFQHKVISPSIDATMNEQYDKTKPDGTMVEGISDQQYQFGSLKTAYVFSDIHVPLTYWRSVTSSTVAFAHECFLDELAVKAGKDPMEFRLAMLPEGSDTKRVLEKLREVSGWDKPLPRGWGRGVAQYEFFAGLAGKVVEVSTQANGAIKVEKVYSVIDLGTVVNPDNVKAQVEGAVAMALTAATKDAITFENGRTVQTNFHNNRMLRINEMPKVEVHILAEGGPKIKGVGEPGLPPLAPALANAIYDATKVRIRRMPFSLEKA